MDQTAHRFAHEDCIVRRFCASLPTAHLFFRRYSVNRFEFMFRKVLNGYDCIISVDLTLLGKKAS